MKSHKLDLLNTPSPFLFPYEKSLCCTTAAYVAGSKGDAPHFASISRRASIAKLEKGSLIFIGVIIMLRGTHYDPTAAITLTHTTTQHTKMCGFIFPSSLCHTTIQRYLFPSTPPPLSSPAHWTNFPPQHYPGLID